ncbi:hypothetical protein ACFXKY_40170 [Streptomyces canus]
MREDLLEAAAGSQQERHHPALLGWVETTMAALAPCPPVRRAG